MNDVIICSLCEETVADGDGIETMNGVVHRSHRLTDDELYAECFPIAPCTGCEQLCAECKNIGAVQYADGITVATVFRDGRIVRTQ